MTLSLETFMRANRLLRTLQIAFLAVALAAASAAETVPSNQPVGTVEPPLDATGAAGGSAEPEPTEELSDTLSGEEIYDRVLSNRFDSFDQSLEMTSGNRGGNTAIVEVDVKYKDFRPQKKKYLSKSIALYKAPPDVRYMGYLIINQRSGRNDQFVYLPSARRVRRVNLRGESVAGTDFSLEDIIPRELEDANYIRLPDETWEGREAYVVEVRPMEDANSEYSKFVAYVDKLSFVTLLARYWDRKGILFKELVSVVDSITRYDGIEKAGVESKSVWIAKESKVTNTRLESFTTLKITRLVANPKLGAKDFTERKLAQGR